MKPNYLEVIDSSNYEYILFRSNDGRIFLSLCHESGFTSYDQEFELIDDEIVELNKNSKLFIDCLRRTFNHSKKVFDGVKAERVINDFGSWPPVKEAIKEWRDRIRKNT